MFSARSLTFLLGPLFSKKSWLALDLGVCLAAGIRWPGADSPSPASGWEAGVLHIDEAHGNSETSRRLSAILEFRRISHDIPFHFSSFPGYSITDSYDLASLSRQGLSHNAGLVVIDQPYGLDLGRLVSFPVLQPLVSSLRSIAESTNAAILVLLQTQTRSQRSSLAKILSALGVDQVLGLDFYPTDTPKATPFNKLLPRYRSGYLHLMTLASVSSDQLSMHAKLHASDHAFSLTLVDHIPDLQTLKLSTFQPALGPAGYEILSLLQAKGSASTRQLIEGTSSASPGRVVNLIKELSKYSFICRTQPGGKGVPTNYALKPAGSSLIQGHP